MRQVLLRAVELLERDGWRQGNYGPIHANERPGPRCLVGALFCARQQLGAPYDVVNEIYVTLWDTVGRQSMISWNDRGGRTQQDVLDLLRSAAGGSDATHLA
jgi:hypothetical protein